VHGRGGGRRIGAKANKRLVAWENASWGSSKESPSRTGPVTPGLGDGEQTARSPRRRGKTFLPQQATSASHLGPGPDTH